MDLKTIKDKPLTLETQVFDPNEIFLLILTVFTPLSAARKVRIVFKAYSTLYMPNQ